MRDGSVELEGRSKNQSTHEMSLPLKRDTPQPPIIVPEDVAQRVAWSQTEATRARLAGGPATAAKKAPVVNGFLTLAANCGASLTITGGCAMEITREVVTVFANPTANHFVLSGYRLVLTTEEAHSLAGALNRLERPAGDASEAGTSEPFLATALAAITDHPAATVYGPRHLVRPSPAEAEAMQQRARALIQGSIREKGLSLREEQST
jgi:hypothetical protein